MNQIRKQNHWRPVSKRMILRLTCVLAYSLVATQLMVGQRYTVLYSFTGGPDGGGPTSGLIKDPAGNLYGTTSFGGDFGNGAVFKFSTRGKESVLYSFKGGIDGAIPTGGLVRDQAGNLYGTTTIGGAFYGTVFKLDPNGNESVLYSFTGFADGGRPQAGLLLDPAGILYGTTFSGGTTGVGTVFSVDMNGHETVLHSFTAVGGDGAYPYAALIEDSAGNLYGTTFGGGVYGYGTVFKVTRNGDATTLYSFTGAADGAGPISSLLRDNSGNLYGTALRGGDQTVMCNGYVGCGTVFKVTALGNESVLYSFTGAKDGANPAAGLVADPYDHLYGTAQFGGSSPCSGLGCGTVFMLSMNGERDLHSFTGGTGGSNPQAGMIRIGAGLYGTTPIGGAVGSGTLYRLTR